MTTTALSPMARRDILFSWYDGQVGEQGSERLVAVESRPRLGFGMNDRDDVGE